MGAGLALVAGVVIAIAARAPDPSAATLWAGDFDGDGDGDWRERFGVVHERDEPVSGPSVVPAPGRPGEALRITFGEDGSRWGMDVRSSFSALGLPEVEEACLAYDVWFADDFQFIGDGKMGGLAGTSGGMEPYEASSGGEFDDRSFSVRAMWQEDRGVTMYLYAHHGAGRDLDDPFHGGFGIHTRFEKADGTEAGVLRTETWHRIRHCVTLNTPGEDDGVYELWVDGHRGVVVDDIRFRDADHPDLRINQVMAAFFFGGGTDEYPTRTNVLYTDDWQLSELPRRPGGGP